MLAHILWILRLHDNHGTHHVSDLMHMTFILFCLLFIVLCWYIVFVSCIFQVEVAVRENETKIMKNREKTRIYTHGIHHGVCHGACHDVATTCTPKSQENQRETFLQLMAFVMGLKPMFSTICTHGVCHEAWKIALWRLSLFHFCILFSHSSNTISRHFLLVLAI